MTLGIVTALYGESHYPFLAVLLESLRRVGHEDVIVVHAGVAQARLAALPGRPTLVGLNANDFGDRRSVRVGRKVIAWEVGLDFCDDGALVICLDADTMALGPLDDMFTEPFDVAYTTHPGRWPINSGVVALRVSEPVRRCLRAWRDLTDWTLADPMRQQTAVDHYGAADQAALMMVLALYGGHGALRVRDLPGDVWNETDCPADLSVARIVHLKGCLPLLLGTRPYGPEYGDERIPARCEPMFNRWRAMAREVGVL